MHLFYYPTIPNETFTLDKTESAHCVKVLRLKAGDFIHLTDGKGKMYRAGIVNPDFRACSVRIEEITDVPPERSYSLNIAIAPTKNIERFEWFLEKTTEIGIDRIIPLLTKNSERRVIKEERLRKVTISAIKQSLKARLPEIDALTNYEELVSRQFTGQKFIATGSEPPENNLGKLYNKGSDVLVLVGPEGDFNADEMKLAIKNNFIPVSLGRSRLRTETAGLVACHSVNLINNSPREFT